MRAAINRVPDGSSPDHTIEAAVDDVLSNYSVRPYIVARFVRDGLYQIIEELLYPEKEEELDADLAAQLDELHRQALTESRDG
jgi:hypothetical protein